MTLPVLQTEMASAQRPSILVLDDRHENLEVIEAILSGLDVTLLFATSGLQALELFEGHRLAVALLDVCIPGMDGFEVALRMRSRDPAVPIIFVTALDRSEESLMRAYSMGSADFLYKLGTIGLTGQNPSLSRFISPSSI